MSNSSAEVTNTSEVQDNCANPSALGDDSTELYLHERDELYDRCKRGVEAAAEQLNRELRALKMKYPVVEGQAAVGTETGSAGDAEDGDVVTATKDVEGVADQGAMASR